MVAVAQPSLNVEFIYAFISFETGRKGYSIQVFQQKFIESRCKEARCNGTRLIL